MLADSKSLPKWRIAFMSLVVVYAAYILVSRLWSVQIVQHEEFVTRSSEQGTVHLPLAPARGEIVDRNGLPLARNRPSFDVELRLDELVRYYQRDNLYVPRTNYMFRKKFYEKEIDIAKIVYESIRPLRDALGLTELPSREDLIRHFRTEKERPMYFRTTIDFPLLAKYFEQNLKLPGIDVVARPSRDYAYGALGGHLIGYVGAPEDQSKALAVDEENKVKIPYDLVGRKGIEVIMDPELQGKPGYKVLRVNYRGLIENEQIVQEATIGNSLKLTLDARVQWLAEQALRKAQVGRAAAVVVDAKNGDILAMASVPDFDPNDFIPSVSPAKWKELTTDPTKPLFNRAVGGYPPGSTYKVLIAMAALKSGAITPNTIVNSPGMVYIAGHPFRDWSAGGQGPITVHDALRMSCNTFFYQVGVKAGIEAIADLGRTAGFGQSSGIEVDAEQPGIMPDKAWMKKHFPRENWTSATTANVSIGQGFVLCTPLQMAVMTAAVGNGGKVYKARLIKSSVKPGGLESPIHPDGEVIGTLNLTPEHLRCVQEGMRAVVVNGTGRRAEVEGFPVAGKTGTAQAWTQIDGRTRQDNKAWFISYAPYDNPRYASCIMVEGGTAGGRDAAPIAQEIYSGIMKLEKGELLDVAYVKPMKGHFRGTTIASPSASGADSTTSDAPVAAPPREDDIAPRRPSIMLRRSWRE